MKLIGRSERFLAAPPARVWAVLADVDRWRDWMPGIRWAVLEGDLMRGAYVTIRPLRGRQTAYRVAVAAPPVALGLGLTFGPAASVLFTLTVEPHDDGTRAAYAVETGGPFRRWLVARRAAQAFGTAQELLAALESAATR